MHCTEIDDKYKLFLLWQISGKFRFKKGSKLVYYESHKSIFLIYRKLYEAPI